MEQKKQVYLNQEHKIKRKKTNKHNSISDTVPKNTQKQMIIISLLIK